MSSADQLTMRIRLGYRYVVTLSAPLAEIHKGAVTTLKATWSPKMPTRLSSKEQADYRRGRDCFVAEMANIIGGRVMVAETGTGNVGLFEPEMPTTEQMQ